MPENKSGTDLNANSCEHIKCVDQRPRDRGTKSSRDQETETPETKRPEARVQIVFLSSVSKRARPIGHENKRPQTKGRTKTARPIYQESKRTKDHRPRSQETRDHEIKRSRDQVTTDLQTKISDTKRPSDQESKRPRPRDQTRQTRDERKW